MKNFLRHRLSRTLISFRNYSNCASGCSTCHLDESDCDDEHCEILDYSLQEKYMNEDMCIIVSPDDIELGYDSKKNVHRVGNILCSSNVELDPNGQDIILKATDTALHRAFSVFLFNPNGELLLQQRSGSKITFPFQWTNTCCSHPLQNLSELGSAGLLEACERKLFHELNLDVGSLDMSTVVSQKIIYTAFADVNWGEYELDYCVLMQLDENLGEAVNPNIDEVMDTKWVSSNELKGLLDEYDFRLTPWFRLISEDLLFEWWELIEQGNFDLIEDNVDGEIVALGEEVEFLEQFDEYFESTGEVYERKYAHKKGEHWHECIYLWISDHEGNLVLQKRSLNKAEDPGAFDMFGSTPKETVEKEAEEELGLMLEYNDLRYIGKYRYDGGRDKEICYVYHYEIDKAVTMEEYLDQIRHYFDTHEHVEMIYNEVEGVYSKQYTEILEAYENQDEKYVVWPKRNDYLEHVFRQYFAELYGQK